MTAGELLGRAHPLTRATRRVESARLQLLVGLTVLAAIVLFAHGPARGAELAVAIATCAVLGALAAGSWANRRRRALELIIAGDEDLPLDELEPVRRRLRDPRGRVQLASSLERCLRSAERWNEIAPHMRPVGNVRLLLLHEDLVRDIARLLRVAAPPRVRGVALCEWLLTDGVTSPLFREDGEALRRELGRIRFALDAC
ncbi:MAG: hypothetical protein M3Q31_05515 [Actinomycetota bacterium]|nr:hypothetical protein [Actinomycetota bacterium]